MKAGRIIHKPADDVTRVYEVYEEKRVNGNDVVQSSKKLYTRRDSKSKVSK